MGEFGDRLSEAREGRGLTLKQVEDVIHIRQVFLKALEEERFDDLPGDVYARGFIHNYAVFLDLPSEELLALYAKLKGEATDTPSVHIPQVLDEPLLHRPRPKLWANLLLAFVIVVAVAAGGWYAYNRFYLDADPWAIFVKPTATLVMATPVLPTETVRRIVVTVTPLPPTPEPTATQPPTPELTPTAMPALISATETPTPLPEAEPTPSGIHVEAEATEETYLHVTVDGEMVFEEMLKKGDTQAFDAEQIIAIRVGNAAGLRVTVNGVEVGPLGEEDEVVDLEYTLDNLPES